MQFTDLPPEVLMHILGQLRPERSSKPYSYDINTIRAIAQVNKHCFRLAEPILYSSVKLGSWYTSDVQIRGRQRVLVRKLEASPRLYSCIRYLSLKFVTRDVSEMLKTLAQCANLTVLTLDGRLTEDDHEPLRKLLKSSRLRELHLVNECAIPVLGFLLVDGAPSNLKVLKVNNSVSPAAAFPLPPSTAHSDIEELVLLTSFWPDNSIMTLMRWSRQLRVFKLSINREFYDYHRFTAEKCLLMYGMAGLQRLLDIQSGVLEHIDLDVDVRNVWNSDVSMVDLSLYANLKWLKVGERDIFDAMSPERMCSSLPPGLACLEIGITPDEHFDMDFEDRIEHITTWLETFFTIRAQIVSDHRLKRIHISRCFDDRAVVHCPITGYIRDEPWPLDVLENVASALIRFDVSVTLPEPYFSKNAWQLMIKDQTIPNWEYTTTKAERLAVIPATDEEIAYHYDSGVYSHASGQCLKVMPHNDENAEMFCTSRITQADIVENFKICHYFKQSCMHPVPFSRRVCKAEKNYSEHLRMQRNQKEGLRGDHDAPECAKSLEDLREYERGCRLSGVSTAHLEA